MKVEDNKKRNLQRAQKMIKEAAEQGAQMVMLPEMFNCPYDINCFRPYAEKLPQGETVYMLAEMAREKQIYLIGGSIPELDDDENLYNTCLIFNPEGKLLGKHRKIHLFDVQVKNGISFKESKVLKGGNNITVVATSFGKIGVMICFDIRFPELCRIMAMEGAGMIFVPAAFNMTTGPAHWETLFKSRALDNQVFVLGNSPARNEAASYIAYGHSLAVDPWGQIIAKASEDERLLLVELNLAEIEEARTAIPIWKQRRTDLYRVSKL
jgi:predicted amidohydrolase